MIIGYSDGNDGSGSVDGSVPRSTDAYQMDDRSFEDLLGRIYGCGRKEAFFVEPGFDLVSFFSRDDFCLVSAIRAASGGFMFIFWSYPTATESIAYDSGTGRCLYRSSDDDPGTLYGSRREMIDGVPSRENRPDRRNRLSV